MRVNAICPRTVQTPMPERVFAAQPDRRAAYAAAEPMGRDLRDPQRDHVETGEIWILPIARIQF